MRKKKADPWQELIQMVPLMDDNYQSKMEFASNFLRRCDISGADNIDIWMGSVNLQTLKFFIYTIITEYEKTN